MNGENVWLMGAGQRQHGRLNFLGALFGRASGAGGADV